MTNRKLRAALLQKLGVSHQRLSQRVQALKTKCPMTTEEATYCIAHREGLKLDKFLPKETVDRARELLSQLSTSAGEPRVAQATTKAVIKTREVNIGGEIKIDDPILPEKVLNEAREMAGKVYPMLYVFENSVREVIRRMLVKKFGEDWWNTANISQDIRADVQKRQQKEEKHAWHGKRGAHPIYYTDIDDLVRIVQSNWQAFEMVFSKQHWFANIVESVEMSRNPVAHMNPLGKHDIDRVRMQLRDWQRQIASKKPLLV